MLSSVVHIEVHCASVVLPPHRKEWELKPNVKYESLNIEDEYLAGAIYAIYCLAVYTS